MAAFESMPTPIEQAASVEQLTEFRAGLVVFAEQMIALGPLELDLFGGGGLKRRPPTPAPDNDFIEPETGVAASTPAVQPSPEAQANVLLPTPSPQPVPVQTAKRQYSRAKLTIQWDAPACRWLSDRDKWVNLIGAGRRDLAARLDCVEIPAGQQVILLDELDIFRQIYWEHDGTEFQGWLLEDFALNDFDMELKKSCNTGLPAEYSACYDKVSGQFERLN